tara:strand:- start:45 stop:1052 length:1008 start_codon:yes stop_codon:yes gene_type:complete
MINFRKHIFLICLIILLYYILKNNTQHLYIENFDSVECKLIWCRIYHKIPNIVSKIEHLTPRNNILIYRDYTKFKKFSALIHKIQFPFKIIFHFGDICLPIDKRTDGVIYDIGDFDAIHNNNNLKEIWCVNYDFRKYKQYKKIKFLPLGLDFHTIAEKNEWGEKKKSSLEQENELIHIYEKYGKQDRLNKVFICNKNNTSNNIKKLGYIDKDREDILNDISNNENIIKCQSFIARNELWKTFCKYKFIICPAGNGLDTHRLWEALYLGCIAIVQSCSLDPFMKQFPVVIYQDFKNITIENLNEWNEKFYPMTQDYSVRKKYLSKYWIDKILNLKE